jgi:hypothetical protein
MTISPLYFGCLDRSGHYWWTSPRECSHSAPPFLPPILRRHEPSPLLGLGPHAHHRYRSSEDQRQGSATFIRLTDFTLLTFWDRSVDRRLGSFSAFAVPGDLDYSSTRSQALAAWPMVWARFSFQVQLCTEHDLVGR